MLIRLLPEQVEKAWEAIAPMIESSLPPMVFATYPAMIDVLEAILLDRAIVWIYYSEDGKPVGLVLTTDYVDPIVHTRYMLVYAVYGIRPMGMEIWKNSIETLKKYADSIKASGILAYTNNDAVAKMVEAVGGSAEYRLLEI